MEITMGELFLFGWAMVVTILWQQEKQSFRVHRMMTGEVFMRIARGKIKVTESEDSFNLEEVAE